jgi:exopolyphosphatase/guanosine-5'-triphosphate,3'-diphosphate pyrophosphatase
MPNFNAHSPSAGPSSAEPVLAALDLGTNNCRLLVARPDIASETFAIIDSFSRIVRLGEGVARSGLLSENAMGRTINALRVCARLMTRHQVTDLRCVATEACRRADNGPEFLERVRRGTGIELDVLGPQDEVALALLGCLPLIDPVADHVLLVDIGGGSTELAWLDRSAADPATSLRCAVSLPIGVVSLTEMFSPEPDEAAFDAMVRHVQTLLAPVEQKHRFRRLIDGRQLQMLGTSGTVTTLAAVLLDLPRYDRREIDGLVVDPDTIQTVARDLRGMSNAERMRHPCIGSGRADLVVAGCAILGAILRYWPADTLRVADRGLREGILHSLMGRTLEGALAATTRRAPSPDPCSPPQL